MEHGERVHILEEATVVLLTTTAHLTSEGNARKYLEDLKEAWAEEAKEK